MKRRRRWLRIVVGLAVLVVGLLLLGRWFLTSRFAARIAARQLQQRIGAPVSVGGIDVGLTKRIILRDVCVSEPDGQPWLVAPEVRADVGLVDLIGGSAEPHLLQARQLRLELRFSEQGQLLTALPGASDGEGAGLPEIVFDEATLVLRQKGRAAMSVGGLRGRLHAVEGGQQVDAEVNDAVWGNWKARVGWGVPTGPFTLRLRTDRVAVTPALVEGIPFLFPEVARAIRPTGRTSADIALRLEAPAAPRYRAVFEPDGLDFEMPEYGLKAAGTRGRVVVEDGLVTFESLTARMAGGEVAGSGIVDFGSDRMRARLALSAREVQLRRLPAAWSVPEPLEGSFTGSAQLLAVLTSPPTVTGSGQGVVSGASWDGVPTAGPVPLRLRAGPEGLAWSQDWPPFGWPLALVTALARFPLFPPYLHVKLRLRDVPLERLTSLLKLDRPLPMQGRLSTDLDVAIPIEAVTDPRRYFVRGRVEVNDAEIDGQRVDHLKASLQLRRGMLVARLELERVPLAGLLRNRFPTLPLEQGTLSGRATVQLPLDKANDPQTWQVEGRLVAEGLRMKKYPLDWVEASFAMRDGAVEVREVQAGWQGLRVEGSARAELGGTGAYRAELRLRPAELELVKQLLPGGEPALPLGGELTASATLTGTARPFALRAGGSGRVEKLLGGTVQAQAVAFRWELEGSRFEVRDIRAERIEIDRVPLTNVVASGVLDDGQVEFRADATLFDGDIHVDGRSTRPIAWGQAGGGSIEGAIKVEGVPIGRFGRALRLDALTPLSGDVDLESTYRFTPGEVSLARWWDSIQASGRLWLTRTRWDRTELSPELRAELRWQGEHLEVRELTGSLIQGRLRARGQFFVEQPARSWFEVNLDRVEAGRLLTLLESMPTRGVRPAAKASPAVEGPVELRLRGSLGPTWRGAGQLVLGRGKVFGVEVNEGRLPFRLSYDPRRGSGQVDVHDSSAQVARGRVVGEATLGWGLGSHVKGSLRFYHIHLPMLLRPFVQLQQIGQGCMSGRLDFAGRDVRGLNDLSATLDADLRQTQALEFPVLREVNAFFPNVRSSTLFAEGTARATLSRGVVRLQRLSLEGSLLDLLVEGTATVPQGRLALEITARSAAMMPDPMVVRLLGLPLIGPVPTMTLVRASNYLASRVLHLRVTGTARSPNVRIEPVPLLTDEAVRFFLVRPSLPRR